MVSFLIKRPIAVIMAFLAVVILGSVTFFTLPVSLLPDVAIPHISVHVSGENLSARELENTMVAPIRRQLMHVSGLKEINCQTRDESAVINLTMDYGVDTDLAYIEVNEKVDLAMNSLPRDAKRPKTVKASATDIPVLYVNMVPGGDNADFQAMADIAENIVRRRLEQLPEVAMVDITGLPHKELRLLPDNRLMKSAGITEQDIELALQNNNIEPGSMTVRDGYYEYNIHVANHLRTPDDVRNVKFKKNGIVYTLGEFCELDMTEQKPAGYSIYNGKRAITMGVIKHSAESMDALEKAIDEAIAYFSEQYPDVEFNKSRNQTELLNFTISNLKQNLLLGLVLVFFVCAIFMRSARLPLIIGITIVVALVMTFLLFYFFKVSINIISLAGLILAVGMMIDNSVIVAENITQFRDSGRPLFESCVAGTNEMITPMLSSSLTTVAVFVPLVFMSGIAGAIFADQAFSITAGLAASYVVGITLLPVLYYLFYKNRKEKTKTPKAEVDRQRSLSLLDRIYEKGISWFFRHKRISYIFVALAIVAVWPMFELLDTDRMPKIDSTEIMLTVDWNENITTDINRQRSLKLASVVDSLTEEFSSEIGIQDYLLENNNSAGSTGAQMYFRSQTTDNQQLLKKRLSEFIANQYPLASFSFSAPENVFEKVFSTTEPPLAARLFNKSENAPSQVQQIERIVKRLSESTGKELQAIPMKKQFNLIVSHELLELYNIDYQEVEKTLQRAFIGSEATSLRSAQENIPIKISGHEKNIENVLSGTLIKSRQDNKGISHNIPLKAIVTVAESKDFKEIYSDETGDYVPIEFEVTADEAETIMNAVNNVVNDDENFDVIYTGSLFSNKEMIRELAVILLISLLMMYFILCAQLGSFIQPLIILIEIPMDITFALISLWIFGYTLNLMSAIGIIVTCGIVVNDSILKLDAINELRGTGMSLADSIHTAGLRRLKPIVMTSLTTILAMVPVLFTSDMGSELQRPLAVAMIGSMIVGTLISVFIIPLIYYTIYRNKYETA